MWQAEQATPRPQAGNAQVRFARAESQVVVVAGSVNPGVAGGACSGSAGERQRSRKGKMAA